MILNHCLCPTHFALEFYCNTRHHNVCVHKYFVLVPVQYIAVLLSQMQCNASLYIVMPTKNECAQLTLYKTWCNAVKMYLCNATQWIASKNILDYYWCNAVQFNTIYYNPHPQNILYMHWCNTLHAILVQCNASQYIVLVIPTQYIAIPTQCVCPNNILYL